MGLIVISDGMRQNVMERLPLGFIALIPTIDAAYGVGVWVSQNHESFNIFQSSKP